MKLISNCIFSGYFSNEAHTKQHIPFGNRYIFFLWIEKNIIMASKNVFALYIWVSQYRNDKTLES